MCGPSRITDLEEAAEKLFETNEPRERRLKAALDLISLAQDLGVTSIEFSIEDGKPCITPQRQ